MEKLSTGNEYKCPISGVELVLEREIEVAEIVKLYNSDFGVDVSYLFGNQRKITLMRSRKTDLGIFYPFQIAGDGAFYENIAKNKISYYTPWKWEHQNALSFIESNFKKDASFKVLEIGCAEGLFLKTVLSSFTNAEVIGLEINPTAVEIAMNNGINAVLNTVEEFEKNGAGEYDVVVAFQVLEHIAEIKSFIDASVSLLKPNGFIVIGVPNNDSLVFKWDRNHTLNIPPHHMSLWNEKSLKSVADYWPLSVEGIYFEPADMNNLGIYFDAWLIRYMTFFRKIFYPLFRPVVKILLRLSPPKYGLTMTAIYRKRNSE